MRGHAQFTREQRYQIQALVKVGHLCQANDHVLVFTNPPFAVEWDGIKEGEANPFQECHRSC